MKRIVSTRIILLACLLSGSASAIAQAPLSFEPGFVVLAAGDTLRGEVALEADILASRRAVFRPNADSESTTYYPEDILGYGTDSGRHFRALELVPARGAEPERLFLRRLVTGALNLYAFAIDHRLGAHENINARHGHASGRFAIERSSGVVTALYTERRAVRVDGALHTATDHQYQRALATAFADCAKSQRSVPRLRYTQSALVQAVSDYNACVGGPVFVTPTRSLARQSDVTLSLTVRAGGGATSVYHPGGGSRGSMRMVPYAGVVLNVQPLPGRSKASIPIEVALRSFDVDEEVLVSPYRHSDVRRQSVAMTIGARYRLSRSSWEPSVSAGLLAARVLGERRRQNWSVNNSGLIILIPWATPAFESGVFAEAGIQRQRYSFALRWEATDWGKMYPLATLGNTSFMGDLRTRNVLALVGVRF